MEGYNFLYDKMIDQADYERFKIGLTYNATTTPSDLTFMYNVTTKLATISKTTVEPRAGFKIAYSGLKLGDVIEVECEVLNTGSTKFKIETNEMGYIKTVFPSSKSDDWEIIKFKYLKRWDSNFEIFFGLMETEVGTTGVRNVSVKVHTKTKPLHVIENIKRYVICKQQNANFELRADFANDVGTLSFPDSTSIRLTFGTQFANKRPMVIVSEGGYNESIKYRAKAYDVQKNFITIKLFNSSNVAVDITQIPVGEYIFINVLAIDELTLL